MTLAWRGAARLGKARRRLGVYVVAYAWRGRFAGSQRERKANYAHFG
jgi:hypothetical protein